VAPVPTVDDLAKAADVAADLAAPVADAAPPADGPKASSDDIDLSALGLDPGAAAFDDKLNIYGFADIGWSSQHWVRKIPTIPKDTRAFAVGNLNIYLAKNLTSKARTLAEVRFTFLPNGSQNPDGTYLDNSAEETTNFNRVSQWGGVVIERAYLEYDLTEHLTLRAGRWLTPYGIWNIDHGSPAILGVIRPYIVGEQFFPEHQTGLDLFGDYYQSGFKLDYHLTASNGRGAAEAQTDVDLDVALGANATLETPWGVKLGGSYYRGRYTGFAATPGGLNPTFQESSYGVDAQYDLGPLHAQVEVIARERTYDDGARTATAAGFSPDSRDLGFYCLLGYRFARLWNVMPYGIYERYEPGEGAFFKGIKSMSAGLNFRPTGSMIFKVQTSRTAFDTGPELLAGQKLYFLAAQASWVF
ncbi:MAG: hypothetical protein H7138_15595, partial [Myxococcales bacterium]|nr:hypothetical protein [Myxococcales bacterium]